jgi:DNA mismatch endonuclease (patch repair protein)
MADMFTKAKRSTIMSGIRSKGNSSTEMRLIAIMKKFKITGWRRGVKLPGKPDFVFRRARLVVFVDGDFWHGNPRCKRLPKSNIEYWQKKIEGNCVRDKKNTRTLKRLGWHVIRVWESDLRDEEVVAKRISAAAMCDHALSRGDNRGPGQKGCPTEIRSKPGPEVGRFQHCLSYEMTERRKGKATPRE